MTLVVARTSGDLLRLECDTYITDPNAIRRGATFGALKAIILHPTLCVAYAGNASRGQISIRDLEIPPGQAPDLELILHRLLRAHQEGGGDTDFLVAALLPSATLCRVADGKIERELVTSWIGDHEAFGVYQRHYHSLPQALHPSSPGFHSTVSRMVQAFMAVIYDRACPSVDGYQLSVMTDRDGLRYAPAAIVFAPPQVIPSGILTPIQFGSAADRGFAYTVMVPMVAGVGAVGIHFLQGNFGALFYPQAADSAIVIADVGAEAFRQAVQDRHGIELSGGMLG